MGFPFRSGVTLVLLSFLSACGGSDSSGPVSMTEPSRDTLPPPPSGFSCLVPSSDLLFILRPEAIPALSNPRFVPPSDVTASYVKGDDRVLAMIIDGEPLAVPLKLIHWHETINLDRGGQQIALSYCPLTGTPLAFDRTAIGGLELGISGILWRNNQILFTRGESNPSFFPQMLESAQCGPMAGSVTLDRVPVWELRLDAWLEMHPESLIGSGDTGWNFPYQNKANVDYERIDNPLLQFPHPIDRRRQPKERVLGISFGGDGGLAIPFELMKNWERKSIPIQPSGIPGVVFWDRAAEAAIPFFTERDGEIMTFTESENGFVDDQTGSTWRLDGLAVDGPLAGTRLDPMPDPFVAFWFAWANLNPETLVWRDVPN